MIATPQNQGLSLIDLMGRGEATPDPSGLEFHLNEVEKAKLVLLLARYDECKKHLKPFLFEKSNPQVLVIDVETDTANRDNVKLVGVFDVNHRRIFHFKRKLSRGDLIFLYGQNPEVVFVCFNMCFDLNRAFDESAREMLWRCKIKFGDKILSYLVPKREEGGVKFGYALDVMLMSENLIRAKRSSLKHLSLNNKFFKKADTDDFLDPRYNACDLLSTFELLVRCLEKIEPLFDIIGNPKEMVEFALQRHRFEPVETHASPAKLFESAARVAKALVVPYAKYPAFPAFYCGARTRAFQTGEFEDFGIMDLRSAYPSIISRMPPSTLRLVTGKEGVALAEKIRTKIYEVGAVEAVKHFYVDQNEPTFLMSAYLKAEVSEPVKFHVEWFREKSKKAQKLSPTTMIYRNKRGEQARDEGFTNLKPKRVYELPFYFLFINSPEALKKLKILDVAGFTIAKDKAWTDFWEEMYELREKNPAISKSVKKAMNCAYGLLSSTYQQFSNLALGAHITAAIRVISYLVEDELGGNFRYTDCDSFFAKKKALPQLENILTKVAPWGADRQFEGADKLVIFRTKRYAVREGGIWKIRGGEKFGGREKNRLLSYLTQRRRFARDDIRQVSKQHATPNIPAVRKLLKDSKVGEWCYYFSYPKASVIHSNSLNSIGDEIVSETTKSKMVYFASRSREALVKLADTFPTTAPANVLFKKSEVGDCPEDTFRATVGFADTCELGARISQTSLLRFPLLDIPQRLRWMAKTIGKMGVSNNRVVKLSVESWRMKNGQIVIEEPRLHKLPRRVRKKSPFAQRRFVVSQQYPYEIRYYLGGDSIGHKQVRMKNFLIVHNKPPWTYRQIVEHINVFRHDVQMLEDRLNECAREAMDDLCRSRSEFRAARMFSGDLTRITITPYARFHRFDLAYDMAMDARTGRMLIKQLENLCEEDKIPYTKGLGYIGVSGRQLTETQEYDRKKHCSKYFLPANIVFYNRKTRFDLRRVRFLRKYSPLLDTWSTGDVARLEIQTFSNQSHNRKANPMAARLNALENLKNMQPKIYDWVLAVVTHMYDVPPTDGSDFDGFALTLGDSAQNYETRWNFDRPPPQGITFYPEFPIEMPIGVAESIVKGSYSSKPKMRGGDVIG